MNYTFLSAMLLLFFIFDPLGNIPIFANALKTVNPQRRWKIIVREHIIGLSILLLFMFAGQTFLSALGLTTTSLQITGGIILFLIAIKMIFPTSEKNEENGKDDEEPFIVPLAIPSVAGPTALATVMILVSQQPSQLFSWIGAATLAMTMSTVVLLVANKVQDKLGKRFITAMERLMGLILVAIAVEMFLKGVKVYLAS